MPVEILMPELGESVHEGTVSRWLKHEGEYVKEDEPVVEIMTDKVNTELQAPASGVLVKILVPEGGQVEVFHAMGLIEESSEAANGVTTSPRAPESVESEKAEKFEEKHAGMESIPAAQSPTPKPAGRRWYTPVVRSIAKQNNLSDAQLAAIPGTGEGGRVTKKDVEAFLASGKTASTGVQPLEVKSVPPVLKAGIDQEIVPLAPMRKMIAEAMVRSASIPTVSTLTDVDVTKMVKFRDANKDTFPQQFGVKLTYTPFFIKALAEALIECPLVNASLQSDNTILMNKSVHMGVAVALGSRGDEGLIVPVIRDCQGKSLIELAQELESIAGKARSNSLGIADVQGGTFTLTNPGSYGAVLGTPMINAPQSAILGTYAIKKMPVIVEDMIAVRSIMNLVLTYDHRLIDGLLAGRFLQSVKAKLEAFDFFR